MNEKHAKPDALECLGERGNMTLSEIPTVAATNQIGRFGPQAGNLISGRQTNLSKLAVVRWHCFTCPGVEPLWVITVMYYYFMHGLIQ